MGITKSPFKHREDGHAPLSKEAHVKAHGGDAAAAGYEEETSIESMLKEHNEKLKKEKKKKKVIPKEKTKEELEYGFKLPTVPEDFIKDKTDVSLIKRNSKIQLINIMGDVVEPNEDGEYGANLPEGVYFKVGTNAEERDGYLPSSTITPQKIIFDGTNTSVFNGINSEIKNWEENPLWVNSKLKPYELAKNTDGSSMYNEEQLEVIKEHLKTSGEDPYQESFENPEEYYTNFLKNTLQEVTGEKIPENFSMSVFDPNNPDTNEYTLSDFVNLDREDFNWEDIFMDTKTGEKKVGEIDFDPKSNGYGYRIKTAVKNPLGKYVATEWYDNKKLSWMWHGEDGGWYNYATKESAPFNGKAHHPYFEGIIEPFEDDPIDYVDLVASQNLSSSYYTDIQPTSTERFYQEQETWSEGGYMYESAQVGMSDFEKALVNKQEMGSKYGFNTNGTPKTKSQVLLGEVSESGKTKGGYVDYDAIWASENDRVSSTDFKVPYNSDGYAQPFDLYTDAAKQSTQDVLMEAPFLMFGYGASTEQIIANNFPGSNDQKTLQEAYVQTFGGILQNRYYTNNTQEVALENVNRVGEAYLTSSEKEISDLIESGEYEEAAKKTKALGYKLLYTKGGEMINWEKAKEEDALISDYFRVVDPKQEAAAEELAESNAGPSGTDNLEEKRATQSFELKAMAKVLNPEVTDGKLSTFKISGSGLSVKDEIQASEFFGKWAVMFGSDKYDRNWELIKSYANGDEAIVNNLDYLPEGHPMSDAWNTALRNFKTTNRALEINADLYDQEQLTRYEGFKTGLFGKSEREKEADAFENTMSSMDYAQENKTSLWTPTTDRWRDWTENTLMLGKFVGSIAVTKRLPIGWRWKTLKDGTRTLTAQGTVGGAIETWRRGLIVNGLRNVPVRSKYLDWMVTLPSYAVAELGMLTLAEPISQGIGNDPFIIDMNTGEIQPEGVMFGLALGSAGPLWGSISKGVMKMPGAKQATFAMEEFNRYHKWSAPTFRRTLTKQAGQATVGTNVLISSEYLTGHGAFNSFAPGVDYDTWEDMGYLSKEDMKERHGLEHYSMHWFSMFMLGSFTPGKGNGTRQLYESGMVDIATYKGTTRWAQKGSKELGFEKAPSSKNRYTTDQINDQYKKKLKEIEESDLSNEEKSKKIKKLQSSARDMHFDNELQAINKIIEKEQISREERQIVFDLHLKQKNGESLTGKEMWDFANLSKEQLQYYKSKLNIVEKDWIMYEDPLEIDSEYSQYIDAMHNNYQQVGMIVSEIKIKDPRVRNEMVEEVYKLVKIESQIKQLKLGENKDSALSKQKLKKLQEQQDLLAETIDGKMKQYDIDFDIKAERTKRQIEKLAETLGNKVVYIEPTNKERLKEEEVTESDKKEQVEAKDKKYKERIEKEIQENYEKEGGGKTDAGFHEKGKDGKPDKIIINLPKAKRQGTLGVDIHEVGHYILRDAFKETYKVIENGKEVTRERMSQEGVDIVDNFLDNLSKKDRKTLDNMITEGNYRYKDGLPKEKSEYYEEYLTNYLQALKDRDIIRSRGTANKMADIVIPQLHKWGFTKLREIDPVKNAEGLEKLLNDIYIAGERGVSAYDLAGFMRNNASKTAEAFENFKSEKNLANFPEMKKINEVGERYTREEWQEQGKWKEGYEEIIPDLLKLVQKKVSAFDAKAPGLIKDPTTFAWEVIQEVGNLGGKKVGGHVKNFNIEKKTYTEQGKDFGLSGHINAQLNNKLFNVLKRASNVKDTRLESLEKEGVKEIVDRDAVDIIESRADYKTSERIIAESQKPRMWEAFTEVQKQKGAQAEKIHNDIKNEFTTIVDGKPVIDVAKLEGFTKGKKMKNLPLVEGVVRKTVEIFVTPGARVIGPKGKVITVDNALIEKITSKLEKDLAGESANLDATDILVIQKGIERFVPVMQYHKDLSLDKFHTKTVREKRNLKKSLAKLLVLLEK